MSPTYRPIPDDTKVALLRALANGAKPWQVAADLGLDEQVVRRVASAHGYPDRSKLEAQLRAARARMQGEGGEGS